MCKCNATPDGTVYNSWSIVLLFNRKIAKCKMQPDSGCRPGNALLRNPRFIRRHYNKTTDNYVCIMHLMLGAGRRE